MQQASTNVTAISGELSRCRGHMNTRNSCLSDASLIECQNNQSFDRLACDNLKVVNSPLRSSESAIGDMPPQSSHSLTYCNRSYGSKVKKWEKHNVTGHQSLMHYFFGTIYTSSAKKRLKSRDPDDQVYHKEQELYENETLFTARPATWLIKLGVKYELNLAFSYSSITGWKQSLTTFSLVPDDSLIFEFCAEGNLPAIRSLFSRGLSSTKDIGSWGQTPLHVSQNFLLYICLGT